MKKAFTMLELVFVIVIVGILAAVIIPNTRTNPLQEAAIQLISHIGYAQHLAMVDDRYGQVQPGNDNWFISRWQFYSHASNGDNVYTIYSDRDLDDVANPDIGEIAIDPLAGKQMTGSSLYGNNIVKKMNLTDSYGINAVNFTGGCAGVQRIFFDFLGRPHTDNNTPYNNLLQAQCNIRFTHTDNTNITIRIHPETGYACILNDAATDCR